MAAIGYAFFALINLRKSRLLCPSLVIILAHLVYKTTKGYESYVPQKSSLLYHNKITITPLLHPHPEHCVDLF